MFNNKLKDEIQQLEFKHKDAIQILQLQLQLKHKDEIQILKEEILQMKHAHAMKIRDLDDDMKVLTNKLKVLLYNIWNVYPTKVLRKVVLTRVWLSAKAAKALKY